MTRYREIPRDRSEAERQDFLAGGATVEAAGYAAPTGDGAAELPDGLFFIAVGDDAFRVCPQLRVLMERVQEGQGAHLSQQVQTRVRWSIFGGPDPLLRLDIDMDRPRQLRVSLVLVAKLYKDHLWHLEDGGPVLLTTLETLRAEPTDAAELLERSLAIDLPPSPAIATMVDTHSWPRAAGKQSPEGVALGSVTWPLQLLSYTDRDWLTRAAETFDAIGDCAACFAPLGQSPWQAVVDTVRDNEQRRTMLYLALVHPRCAHARPSWNDSGIVLATNQTWRTFATTLAIPEAAGPEPDRPRWWRRHRPAPPSGTVPVAPVALVNPSVDQIGLSVEGDDGQLHDLFQEELVRLGWHQLTPAVLTGAQEGLRTPSGVTVTLSGRQLSITSQGGQTDWGVNTTPEWEAIARQLGYVLIIVTRAPTIAGLDTEHPPTLGEWTTLLREQATSDTTSAPGAVYGVALLPTTNG